MTNSFKLNFQKFLNSFFVKFNVLVSTLFILNILDLSGQQNLFNIPSGDITPKDKFFYQHQINLYSEKLESKAHFVYGLGDGWDCGVNLVGKGLYFDKEWRMSYNDDPGDGALYPIIMGTLQKQFNISEVIDINLGTQIGYNVSSLIKNKEINYFNYVLATYYLNNKSSRIVGGLYQTNRMFVGQGNTYGGFVGFEYKIYTNLYLMGDWVSGNNDASVAVLGGMYNLTKRLQLCAGVQIPNPNTPKPYGLVLELNLLGWDLY